MGSPVRAVIDLTSSYKFAIISMVCLDDESQYKSSRFFLSKGERFFVLIQNSNNKTLSIFTPKSYIIFSTKTQIKISF